jgi:hypothetical protein
MTLTTYLVDINSIAFTQEYAYSPELIEKLASLLLTQQGTTQPIIVKKTGLDEYELVEGEIVLLAAITAHKIDDYFEMVRVIIQEDEDLTAEANLIAEIESTKQSIDPEVDDSTKTPAQAIDKVENDVIIDTVAKATEITKKEPIKDGKWLIVKGKIVDYGEYSDLAEIEEQLRKKNRKIKTEIRSASNMNELLSKREEYLEKLALIEREIEAYKKFLT